MSSCEDEVGERARETVQENVGVPAFEESKTYANRRGA